MLKKQQQDRVFLAEMEAKMDYIGNNEQSRQRAKKARLAEFERMRQELAEKGELKPYKNPCWDNTTRIIPPKKEQLVEDYDFFGVF